MHNVLTWNEPRLVESGLQVPSELIYQTKVEQFDSNHGSGMKWEKKW